MEDQKTKFVVIKHESDKEGDHEDLRFKIPKSSGWRSFAVSKGIPTKIGKEVPAVKTFMHTEKEALVTGLVKTGRGAGNYTKIDEGSCTIIKMSNTNHIILDLKGSKYTGIYHLIDTGKIDKEYKQPIYILFKGHKFD